MVGAGRLLPGGRAEQDGLGGRRRVCSALFFFPRGGSAQVARALALDDPLAAAVPFQPSYEDRPGSADRVFAMVDDAAYERLVAAWTGALAGAGAARAELLHLHHLTPAHEAALRAFPWVPIIGQLHGTELAFLRRLRAGPPPAWRHARAG